MEISPSDEALVDEARAGSRDAAGRLFDRHWREVWRAAYAISSSSEVAEDCAQDAFMRAFAHLGDYRGPSFRAWVTRIAVNRSLDHLRRERRHALGARKGFGDHGPITEETVDPSARMPAPDAALDRALRDLSVDKRAIVVLRFWLGYSPPEVADLLGLPLGTVHSRLSRALTKMREDLEVNDVERA